jgi:hypothetical protein
MYLRSPRPTSFSLAGADAQLLLGARHRVIGGRTACIASSAAPIGVSAAPRLVAGRLLAGFGCAPGGRRSLGCVRNVVVRKQALLLLLRQLSVVLDPGRVLDLIFGHLRADVLPTGRCASQRHEVRLGAKQSAGDGRPLGLAGRWVLVDLGDLADLLAI